MPERPGSRLAQRPLHFIILADCSGSMASDGKMRALNAAIREALPHLADVADGNPHAQLLVRCIGFSTGARWHVEQPTPVEDLVWTDLDSGGYTDLSAGLDLLRSVLTVPPMESRALPPAVVLVSDGMPTDDYEESLQRLEAEPWGARSVRIAVGIGRDADHDMLVRFMGDPDAEPVRANNPEHLVAAIRWASTHVSRVASTLAPAPPEPVFSPAPHAAAADASEVLW